MYRSRTSTALILAALLVPICGIGMAQQIYRWVDENGNVHYGDRAPEGVQAARVTVQPNAVPLVPPQGPQQSAETPDAAGDADAEPELSYVEQRRADRAERRAKAAEEARKLSAECEKMRLQKQRTEPQRVLVTEADGTVRRLDDDERVALVEEANNFLAENCN